MDIVKSDIKARLADKIFYPSLQKSLVIEFVALLDIQLCLELFWGTVQKWLEHKGYVPTTMVETLS